MALNNVTFYVISLKFAPGLRKEFFVLGEGLKKRATSVRYLLCESYRKLDKDNDDVKYFSMNDGITGMVLDTIKFFNSATLIEIIASSSDVPFILFYNPHLLNPRLAHLIRKKVPRAMLALYLHDPYKADKAPYGLIKRAYFVAAEFIQSLTIRYMDYVISPSGYSSKLFKEKYPRFAGKNYVAPLLIPDQRIEGAGRKYFSIVGSAHPATGHDIFIQMVNYIAEKKLPYEFALISSSNINRLLHKLSCEARRIIRVINKRIITDSEINEIIRESYAVFRLDREVTQSGVVPVSYMNETPVIATDIPGLTQHVWHEETGYVVPSGCVPEELVQAMEYVRNNFERLSDNGRKSYENIWAESNWDKYYQWQVDLLEEA